MTPPQPEPGRATTGRFREYIRQLTADWPPLTGAQLAEIRRLFGDAKYPAPTGSAGESSAPHTPNRKSA